MKRFLAFLIILGLLVFGILMLVNSNPVNLNPVSVTIPPVPLLSTPTTVVVPGPVILDAIRTQGKLETASMAFALDQTVTHTWGLEGVCQEKLTYLAYFTVTAGIDLQKISSGNIQVESSGAPPQNSVTIKLPEASILHVELDTKRSRVVNDQVSVISQLCGSQLATMVSEAQANLQKEAEYSALNRDVLTMAQDRAEVELKRLLLDLGFTKVTIIKPDVSAGSQQ